ncbi:hypothetical protein VPH35_063904 [Triticum aestivum]
MDWLGTGPHNPDNAPKPHAGIDSASSRSDLPRRRFVDKYTNDRRPGSVLAQRLVGAQLPLIKCDDCPRKVVPRMSAMLKHPGWLFVKCKNDGDGCNFWYWEK